MFAAPLPQEHSMHSYYQICAALLLPLPVFHCLIGANL